jgi:protease-4
MKACLFASIVFVSIATLTGCTRMRFVIDAVPSEDKLTETVVMEDPAATSRAKVALIDVTGLIADAPRPGLLGTGENPVSRFIESLQKAQNDESVRAVIIRINSPGGTVGASDVMYREVVHFKEASKKPVVIQMGEIAASGGYYLACGGDEIVAMPTTITGSIGVIIQTINFADGMNRIGIRADAITSGPNKDMGNPLEPMTKEHRELLQGLVDEFYANFKTLVVNRRPTLSPNDLEWITDGRVITGQRAVEVGLVDQLGGVREAFAAAKSRAGIESAKLVKYHRPVEYVGSAHALAPAQPSGSSQMNLVQVNLASSPLGDTPNFWYVWDPALW